MNEPKTDRRMELSVIKPGDAGYEPSNNNTLASCHKMPGGFNEKVSSSTLH